MDLKLPTLLVIPTGIGCSLGGYAGDAIPAARLLAAASGCLITHPNVMNGASLYWSDKRIQYVEGYGLDRFSAGEIVLKPVRKQQVGLLLDAGIEKELKERHLQVAEGCRASLGLNIGPVVSTDVPLDIKLHQGLSGSSLGVIGQVDALLQAGEKLKNAGATAIDSNDGVLTDSIAVVAGVTQYTLGSKHTANQSFTDHRWVLKEEWENNSYRF